MTDPFRISSGESKIPDFSTKKDYDTVIEHVRSMEPSTAYVAVKAILLPVLSKLSSSIPASMSALSPMQLATAESQNISHSSIKEAGKALKELQSKFTEIERQLKDLEVSKEAIVKRWEDSFEKSSISSNNEIFKNFYYLRDNLIQDLDIVKSSIEKLRSTLTQTASVQATLSKLEEIHTSLVSKIPNPSTNWNGSNGYWKPPGHKGGPLRFWWEKEEGKPAVVFWKDTDSNLPENPIGLLEMVLQPDQKDYKEYLSLIQKGLERTEELLAPLRKGLLFEPLSTLSTEEAYAYLISTLLPALQNESADAIEKMGDLMKQTSKIFDKYNQIQDEIIYVQKIAKKFMDERGNYFTEGDWKDFERFRDLRTNINILISQVGGLLKNIVKELPPSAQSLVTTLEQINDQLLDMPDPSDKWNPATHEYDGKGWIGKDNNGKDFTIEWKDTDNPIGLIESMLDADQTKFKSYMDSLAQAITAMTSISNMAQQEVQIASQYHNSLLGLQKAGLDSLSKVIQVATRNPNH